MTTYNFHCTNTASGSSDLLWKVYFN